MMKGKSKKEKKYFSILFIPHSPDKVKAFKFSYFYLKLSSIFALTLALFFSLLFFYIQTGRENTKLKAEIQTLTSLNKENTILINEKALKLDELNKKNEAIHKKIQEFNNKYSDMANKYISGRLTNTLVSRAGERSDPEFITDIEELKKMLDHLKSLKDLNLAHTPELTETEQKLNKYIESIPTLRPSSGRISSNFGGRKDPFNDDEKQHKGIDFAAGYGEDIIASASGKVAFSGKFGNYGNTVILNHGRGISTLYAHCSELLVEEGQSVTKGKAIAKVGSSGRSTGPHLHFEVRVNDIQVDPLQYLIIN
ncbi:MAG: peptidoglycan DD-metalloendopeptidase family protein [Clostridia bacterium]|nr:peptidoglycan DD-metalloendopeptidase family protein [Clostridia bacterium]